GAVLRLLRRVAVLKARDGARVALVPLRMSDPDESETGRPATASARALLPADPGIVPGIGPGRGSRRGCALSAAIAAVRCVLDTAGSGMCMPPTGSRVVLGPSA